MSGRSPPFFAAKGERGFLNLIKFSARTLTAAGFVLASIGTTTALADLQLDQMVEKTGAWTIGYNGTLKGCAASASSDDGTTIWLGFEGSEPETAAYLAFTNPSWRSIEARKFYDLEIEVAGSYRWRGYSSGIERPNEKGFFVFGVKRRALEILAETSELALSVNKELLTRTSISGLSDVIEKLKYCQQHRLAALKNPGAKKPRMVAQTPKQPDRETAELPSPPSQISVNTTPEALLARAEGERTGPDEQPKPARVEAQAHAQIIGRVSVGEAGAQSPQQVEAGQGKLRGDEATAGEGRDSAQQPHAEREQIARAPDANEQGVSARPAQQPAALPSPAEPAARQPELNGEALVQREQIARAPDANEQDVSARPAQQPAALPSPAEQAAREPELKGEALVRAIKQELKRVGCYHGPIDHDWQAAPARVSIQKFSRVAGITIPTEPTNALLESVKVRTERVCPPEPVAYPIKRNVHQVARKCPGGFERDEDGDCPRRRAVSRHDIDDDDRPKARSHEAKRRGRMN